jgi:serine/threonine-protein kinase
MSPLAKHAIWLPAYAAVAEDARDAKRALETLPTYAPLPQYRAETTWDAAEGHVYLLAGDAARALPLLERGAKTCLALSDSFGHVAAKLHRGMAREALGDKAGACASYGEVTRQWGNAKPRSMTAGEASRRAKALGCSPLP